MYIICMLAIGLYYTMLNKLNKYANWSSVVSSVHAHTLDWWFAHIHYIQRLPIKGDIVHSCKQNLQKYGVVSTYNCIVHVVDTTVGAYKTLHVM
jgi:hypothetical protein